MIFDTRLTAPASAGANRGKALRAFGWSELSARIKAARDLRQVLHQDTMLTSTSFSDAAAGYFSAYEQGKPAVNPDALEGLKACDGTRFSAENDTDTGDREI